LERDMSIHAASTPEDGDQPTIEKRKVAAFPCNYRWTEFSGVPAYTPKLGSYPRQNDLAMALRELGRIERTLFILDWLQSVELRRRVHAGLNKGEARNALARAVFFNRLGEIRDRSFEQQRYRASGLNLVTAAVVLWNTVYLERAVHALRTNGQAVDDTLLQFLSPLGWEHINLTGDYLWRSSAKIGAGKFRPLRPLQSA
jgi:hypothetical protein